MASQETNVEVSESKDDSSEQNDVSNDSDLSRKALIGQAENVKVFCRVRPQNKREKGLDAKNPSNVSNENKIRFRGSDTMMVPTSTDLQGTRFTSKSFSFDGVLNEKTTQREAFETIATKTCNDLMEGYNGTIFVYGQTGSGKTFTMYGAEKAGGDVNPSQKKPKGKKKVTDTVRLDDNPDTMGIVPQSISYIIKSLKEKEEEKSIVGFKVGVSFVEIYNEKLTDLLDPTQTPALIFDTKKQMRTLQNITTKPIDNVSMMFDLIALATSHRATSVTKMNHSSSRSHMILTVTVEIVQKNGKKTVGIGNFADLAGSERVSKTEAKGQTFEEARKINLSLSVLQRVIESLSSKQKVLPPFKESKLTEILRDSLGGNCKTTLLIAASPHITNRQETVSSLRFGQRCKSITTKATMNLSMTKKQLRSIIEKLQKENDTLKKLTTNISNEINSNSNKQNEELLTKNKMLQQDLEKQIEENKMLKESLTKIENELDASNNDLVSIKAEKATLDRELDEKNDEIYKLTNEKEELQNKVNEFSQQSKDNEIKYNELKEENNEYSLQINNLNKELQTAQNEKKVLASEKDRLERENDTNVSNIQHLESQIEQLKVTSSAKINESKESISNMESKYAKITENMNNQYKEATSKIETLNTNYNKLEVLSNKYEADNNQLKLENEKLKKENNALKIKNNELTSNVNDMTVDNNKLRDELKESNEKTKDLESKNDDLQSQLEILKRELQLKTMECEKLEKQHQNELESNMNELKEEHTTKQAKLAEKLKYLENAYEHAKQVQIDSDRKVALKLKDELRFDAALNALQQKHPNMPIDVLRKCVEKQFENITYNNNSKNNDNSGGISGIGNNNKDNDEGYAITKGAIEHVNQYIEKEEKMKEDERMARQMEWEMQNEQERANLLEQQRKLEERKQAELERLKVLHEKRETLELQNREIEKGIAQLNEEEKQIREKDEIIRQQIKNEVRQTNNRQNRNQRPKSGIKLYWGNISGFSDNESLSD